MPEDHILEPGDLPAEELIRLHQELEGDPTSGAHREAWDRWHRWIADLLATGDREQADRATRITAYIEATFEPPSNTGRQAAALGMVTGGAGAAAYELEQAGQAAATAGSGSTAPAGQTAPQAGHAGGQAARPGTGSGQHVAETARVGRRATPRASARSPVKLARAAFTGPHRALAIFASSATATGVVVVGAVAAAGGFGGPSSTTARGAGHTRSSVTSGTGSRFSCAGPEIKLFDNSNGGGVSGGGTAPSFSTSGSTYCLVQIITYHWNNGLGSPPGTLELVSSDGNVGPFSAKASSGTGNAPNVNWYVSFPTGSNPVVIDGTYTCRSSDASTWSQDSASGGHGFCQVWVRDAHVAP